MKPNSGSGGRGFAIFRTEDERKRLLTALSGEEEVFVVQPLLRGPEYRITFGPERTYAVARRGARVTSWILWKDALQELSKSLVKELELCVRPFGVTYVGCDLIVCNRQAYLLDVNLDPCLTVHKASEFGSLTGARTFWSSNTSVSALT